MENAPPPPHKLEGIEDSIRRCEELLACTPLSFETSSLRRGYDMKESGMDANKEVSSDSAKEASSISAEQLWELNMELLSNGKIRSDDRFDCDKKYEMLSKGEECESTIEQQSHHPSKEGNLSGDIKIDDVEHEWSGSSSEWHGGRSQSMSKSSGSEVEGSTTPLGESVMEPNTVGNSYTILSLNLEAQRSTQCSTLTNSKESDFSTGESIDAKEVISIRIVNPSDDLSSERTSPSVVKTDSKDDSHTSDEDHPQRSSSAEYRSSETEVSELHCESVTICCERESSSELCQAYSLQDSRNPEVVVDASWHISDSSASLESEQKTDTSNSSRSEKNMQKQHNMKEEKRSGRVPKEINMDRLQNLARPRTEVYKKLAELKALLESEKLQQCSFKPCVGRKPGPDSMHFAPISQRIIEMQQRMELRKRARKAYEKEELDNCSFWPQVNCSFWPRMSYQPLQKRFQALQRRKLEKIINARLRKDIGLTFKPEINQKSIELCKQKGLEAINVSDRLTSIQRSVHLDCKLEPQKNIGPFAPEINKNTDYIMASSKQFGGCSVGFLERQKYYTQTTEGKKRLKEHRTPPDLTFRPDIGNSALILKQSNGQDMLEETRRQRLERLAYKDKEQVTHAREKATEDYYAQFHFQPEIDEVSRVLARNNSIHDLYKNEKGKKVKQELEQAAQHEFQQRCPFRPELNSRLRRNEDNQVRNSILQRRQRRKEKINNEHESRTLKELKEMKECTFKPSVNPTRLKETTLMAPAAIKGLERHLELQTSAKQMKRNQEELERKVFFSHAYTSSTRQYTIPRPFLLQTGQGRYSGRKT